MSAQNSMILLGDDQLASQYAFVFPEGIPGGGDDGAITLRLDQTIDPPERTVQTYEFFYRGVKNIRTSMTDGTEKTFTVDARIDQNWKVVNDLERWMYMCYDFTNGTALSDIAVRTTGLHQYFDGRGNIVKQYRIDGLKIKSLKISQSENQSTDPQRITIGFIFNDWARDI